MLMREFERSLERGEDATVANFVLGQLRTMIRAVESDFAPRFNDSQRLLFRPLEPFLAEAHASVGPGQIRRNSLPPVWTWLARDGAPDAARALAEALERSDDPDAAVHKFRPIAIAAITALLAEPDQRRAMARIGPASAIEDLPAIGAVLQNSDALALFAGKIPSRFRVLGDAQIAVVTSALALQTPPMIPFALRLVMQRLPASWELVRLAVHAAATDDGQRVAAHPFGVAVPMAIENLSQIAARLRDDIRRGQLDHACDHVKAVHDGVRVLRTELDIRNDTAWGRSMAMLRVDASGALKSAIDNVPGRVRRLLRQRPDKDVTPTTRLDPTEIDETAALIDFVAVCRSYASELAINEVTLRTFSDLQSYVETSTEALVESLRTCEMGVRSLREQQARAAIRFCEVLFGHDYAVLMSRSADNALADERKPARTG